MAYSVLIQNKTAAQDVSSFNRSFVSSGCDLENGYVFRLDTQNTGDTGYSEVWWTTPPAAASASGSGLAGIWMAASPEVPILVSGTYKYRGLTSDPRNFYTAASTVGDAFKPQPGDIITLTADAFTAAISSSTYANVAEGSYQLVFGSSQTALAASFSVLATTYISIGSGAIDNQRVTAYKLLCLAN